MSWRIGLGNDIFLVSFHQPQTDRTHTLSRSVIPFCFVCGWQSSSRNHQRLTKFVDWLGRNVIEIVNVSCTVIGLHDRTLKQPRAWNDSVTSIDDNYGLKKNPYSYHRHPSTTTLHPPNTQSPTPTNTPSPPFFSLSLGFLCPIPITQSLAQPTPPSPHPHYHPHQPIFISTNPSDINMS